MESRRGDSPLLIGAPGLRHNTISAATTPSARRTRATIAVASLILNDPYAFQSRGGRVSIARAISARQPHTAAKLQDLREGRVATRRSIVTRSKCKVQLSKTAVANKTTNAGTRFPVQQ